MKQYLIPSLLAAIAICADAQTQGVSKTEIVVGTIQDLSGPLASYGKQARNGMQLRADELNEQGGVNGRRIVLKVEDSGYDPRRAVLAAQKLVNQDKIFIMAGHIGTAQNLAAMPVQFEKNVINFLPLTAAREMYEPFHKLKYSFAVPYYEQVRVMTPRLVAEKGAKKICVHYQDDDFGLEVLKGAEAALAAGAHKLTIPFSASPAHSLANVRKTHVQMLDEVHNIIALRNERAIGVPIDIGLSTAFGCTLQGAVDEDLVIRIAEQVARAGASEVGLSDTTGMANPAQVRRLFKRLRAALGDRAGAAHMHNTRGLGLANCLAAFDVGVHTFDASQGGLGGCPYAPGASGNVVTEDLVNMFEAMGVSTGVDLEKMMTARRALMAGVPGEAVYGMTAEAGLNKGFVYADGRRPAAETLLNQTPKVNA